MPEDRYYQRREPVRLEGVSADLNVVKALANELVDAWNEILEKHKEKWGGVSYIDGFMAVHNFHKQAVLQVVEECSVDNPDSASFLLMMAEATWVLSMQEEMKKLPPP